MGKRNLAPEVVSAHLPEVLPQSTFNHYPQPQYIVKQNIVKQMISWSQIRKIEGYLLIPHELLHVVAHRLIGKRCSYRVGEAFVNKLEPCTWRQDLFCLLFPLLVSGLFTFAPLVFWLFIYLENPYSPADYLNLAPVWHPALFVCWFLLFNYVMATCFYDVILSVRILLHHLSQQPPKQSYK